MSNFQKLAAGIPTGTQVQGTDIGSGAATSVQFLAANGSGGSAFRPIVSGDIPTLNQNTTGTAANITATSNSTLTTLSALTTASSLNSIGTIGTGVWQGTPIGPTFGGTGQTSYTTGDTLYASATNVLSKLGIGSTGNILTVSGGVPVWAAPATNGTVTSVAFADASTTSIYSISGSPVTSSGTLTQTLTTQSANKVFAGPSSGSAAQPTFRSLVGADLPNPSATTLGGIESYAAVTNQWINAISTSGVPSSTQPAFSNLSGSVAASQMPALTGDVTTSAGSVATSLVATSNATLTTLSALTTASSLSSVGTVTTGTWNATTVAIAHGGTGQTSAASAFSALSPLTTAGDIIYENATPAPARLAIGSTGQVLTVSGGLPVWAAATPSFSGLTTEGAMYATSATAIASTAAGTTGQVLMSTTSAAPAFTTVPGNTSILKAPTIQRFTSGSGTYTTPTSPSPLYIKVKMVGGGGGGSGGGTASSSSNGSNGGATTFGTSLLTANNGGGGVFDGSPGTGGTATVTTSSTVLQVVAVSGGGGGGASGTGGSGSVHLPGGNGGASVFGGAGRGGGDNDGSGVGNAGAANTGSGGGGGLFNSANGFSGTGGGSGGYVEAIITSPSSTYPYAVGAGGAAGSAGTGGFAAGAGGSGVIIVEEYYQ